MTKKMIALMDPEGNVTLLTPEEFQAKIHASPLEVGWHWETRDIEE